MIHLSAAAAAALVLLLVSVSAWQNIRIHPSSTKAGARKQPFIVHLYLDNNSDDVPRGPGFLGYFDSVASASIDPGVAGHVDLKKRANGAARSFGGYLDSLQQANNELGAERPGFAYFCNSNVKATDTSDTVQAATPKKAKALTSLDGNYLNSLTQEFTIGQKSSSFSNVDRLFSKSVAHQNEPVIDDTIDDILKSSFALATNAIKGTTALWKDTNLVPPNSGTVTQDQNVPFPKTMAGPASTTTTNHDLEPYTSSQVVLNEAAVEFTAGVIGGVVGFAVAGPMGAVAAATVANYCSRQEDEISTVVQGISKTVLEGYNHILKLEAKYDFMEKAKMNVEGTLKKVKKSEAVNGKVIERVEKALGSTVSKVAMIGHETNLWGTTTTFFGFLGDLVEKTVHVAGDFTKELQLVDHFFHGVEEVVGSTKAAGLYETRGMMDTGMPMKGNPAQKADSTQSVKKALFGF